MSDVLYAGAHWVGPAYQDNFMAGRQGGAVTGIVDHHSVSTLQGLLDRFRTSSGVSGGGVSAHFAIDRDGTRYQIVDTADTAFHAGNFAINLTTIGIEHIRQWGAGPGTPGYEPITDAQYQSSHELHVILAADNGFPLDLTHVEPHNHYTQTTCPGDLDIERILKGDTMSPEDVKGVILAAVHGTGQWAIVKQAKVDAWAAEYPAKNLDAIISEVVNTTEAQAWKTAVAALVAAGPAKQGPPGPPADPATVAAHLQIVAK